MKASKQLGYCPNYQFKDVLLEAGISKQGHSQALQRAERLLDRTACYIGFIQNVRDIHPGMGLRKMYYQFEPEHIGRDAFIALGLHAGFRLRAVRNPVRTTFSVKSNQYVNLLEHKVFTGVNQLWTSDITYISLQTKGSTSFYYITLIMDVYSRRIVGYCVADNMRAENNIAALRMALKVRGISHYKQSLIHHSDRGSQYISNDYTDLLEEYGIPISMCSNVLENAPIERVNGTIKNEYLLRWSIRSFRQLKSATDKAVSAYNNRLHNSISKTPIEFEYSIKELPKEERKKLQIFVTRKYHHNDKNHKQLQLNL